VELDAEANGQRGARRISTAASRVAAWVIPTDEELMIARHTLRGEFRSIDPTQARVVLLEGGERVLADLVRAPRLERAAQEAELRALHR
jgi:hypothetical protein